MDLSKPILFVDGSYYVFYRYYATMMWWSKQDDNKNKEKGSAMSDASFVEKYEKMFYSTLSNLMKVYGVPSDNVFIAKDCSRCEIWRHDLYSFYKATRDTKLESFDSTVFTKTYSSILPNKNIRVIEIANLEADDVIALMVKNVFKQNPKADVTIITNDNDYIQLLQYYEDLLIINLQGKQIKKRIHTDVDHYLLTKIIMGDKSDNIPAIMKGCGPKTAEKLAKSPEDLAKVLNKDPMIKQQFELNEKLISFEKIPCVYAREAEVLFAKLLKI